MPELLSGTPAVTATSAASQDSTPSGADPSLHLTDSTVPSKSSSEQWMCSDEPNVQMFVVLIRSVEGIRCT